MMCIGIPPFMHLELAVTPDNIMILHGEDNLDILGKDNLFFLTVSPPGLKKFKV